MWNIKKTMCCEILNRLSAIDTVHKSNGSIKNGEDVRVIYRNMGVPVLDKKEKEPVSF